MVSLIQLALTFLKIGALGFGGPFSLLAIMQKEVVERRKWLTTEDFTQSIGIGTMTPGPIFFAAAIFVGYRLRGIPGAVICGLGTLLPSFILAVLIAALYVEVESSLLVMGTVHGIAAGVVGLFLSVVLKTGRATAKDVRSTAWIVIAFIALAILKVDPLLLIVIAGIAGAWLLRPMPKIQAAEK
ncbi:MAG: chromate transporter [Chloroflexi bacterium]|nr:chromate transporter [Chloroflexota bacterium]